MRSLKRPHQVFSDGQIKQIFKIIEARRIYGWERDTLAVFLGYKLGLRVSEIVNLNITDFDFEDMKLYVKNTKCSRVDLLRLKDTHIKILQDYIDAFNFQIRSHKGYLFFPVGFGRNDMDHVGPNTIRQRFYYYLEQLGFNKTVANYKNGKKIKKYIFHDLRRTFCTNVVERNKHKGMTMKEMATVTRHKDVSTLEQTYYMIKKDKTMQNLDY